MNAEAAFDRYLDEVLRLDRVAATRVDAPVGPYPLATEQLRAALTDPTVLLTGIPADDVRHRMSRLLRLALWLETPAHAIPDELGSRAARYRFLVWSLPSRLDSPVASALTPEAVAWQQGPDHELVEFSTAVLRHRARSAREAWLRHLAAAEDDPWLSGLQTAGDRGLERDLAWITQTWPFARHSRRLELTDPDAHPRTALADHRRVAAEVAEAHWLPRAAVLPAVRGFAPAHPAWAYLGLALAPLAAAAVIVLILTGVDQARWMAVGVVVVAAVTVVMIVPTRTDVLALLRIPAAAAAGDALLLSLTPRWWLSAHGWTIGAALLVAVWCYVTLEARLHGAPRARAIGRAGLVTTVGALYATVLAVVFLGFVVPAMGEQGQCLTGWWTQSPLAPLPLTTTCQQELNAATAAWPAGVLLLMTGWSLAVGVAAQVLWEDRPLTAPLGRLRRVRGSR